MTGTYHSDPVSNCLCGKVAAEFGAHHTTAAMSTSDLSPDDPRLVGLATGCLRVPEDNNWKAVNKRSNKDATRHTRTFGVRTYKSACKTVLNMFKTVHHPTLLQ